MSTQKNGRILIVDDQADFAQGLAMLLRVRGFEVAVVGDGESGLEVVQATRPDVILLDLGLPRMDGYEVARRIRAIDPAYVPRIVALSGYELEADASDQPVEFDGHLLKPVDLAKLVALLNA